MALKKLPGGVIVETEAGARLNEEAGVNLEAIHRQIIAGAPITEAARAEADRAKAEADRATAAANAVRWDRQTPPDGTIPAVDLPSGLHPVKSSTVSKTLGLPGGGSGSLWVHRMADDMVAMEWRPTITLDVWVRRKHGTAWSDWAPLATSRVPLTADTDPSSLATGTHEVRSGSVASALGLPEPGEGSLWVHRVTDAVGRMEWRPGRSTRTYASNLYGAGTPWTPWTLVSQATTGGAAPGDPTPDGTYTASTPTPAGIAALDGAQLAIEATAHTMIPRSVGPDGRLYGYSTTGTQMLRSGDGLATAPEAVAVHTWVPSELRGAGLAHVEATTSGYVFVYRTTAMQSSVWFSESWEGPYRKVLDMGPWHVTSYARPRIVHGATWMMLGEYTNSTIPSTPDRRWLTIDGGKTWRLIRTTMPVSDQTNNHCHTGLITGDGRLYVSNGDGVNNSFEYSDDLGATWKPIPTSPNIIGNYSRTHQPTLMIDWGDRINTSPDAGPYQPGLWEMSATTHAQAFKWEAPGGPYVDASKQYGRSIFAQADDRAWVLFPPGGTTTPNRAAYVAGTPDRGRTWGVVATIDTTGGSLSDGIIGPDRSGHLYMRGINLPGYGSATLRARALWA